MRMNKLLIKRMFIIALALAAVFCAAGCASSQGGEDVAENDLKWGEGITADIPEFTKQGEIRSASDGSYASAYYSDVSGEEIKAYISALEQECGVKFSGEKYPMTVEYGEKTIILHYNVTEMEFSVTVIETQG